MSEEVTLPENDIIYEVKEPDYTCTQEGIYVFEALGFTYTVDLKKGDVVYFNPFRVERRYEKK